MSLVGGHKRHIETDDIGHQSKRTRKSRASKKLTHGDYAFGWVAALPVELAAARAMLDELHKELPRSQGDPNTYTLGEIGDHNIVIASLPSDGYGTINAATVANNMHRTFPLVHDFLMVGIAGGAGITGNLDVRLGDIVVGDRLIQYDLGKRLDNHSFKTTAIHLRLSHRLRSAMTKLRATHMLEESEVPGLIHEIGEKYPKIRGTLIRSSLRDLLFQDTYSHFGSAPHCNMCDTSQLVEREQRQNDNPVIQYGVIASGNTLIQLPERRAQLMKDFQALCFEMEGAGFIENLQCLVIRSICDYADNHKNDLWQPYAAAAAAAYAKELILAMSISEDRASKVDEIQSIVKLLSFERIFSREMSIKPPYSSTCKWILHHPDYSRWLDPKEYYHHHGFLWIRGKPGSGKSTLVKFIHTEIEKYSKTISFFFNARGNSLEKSTQGMYRSLLYQLLKDLPDSRKEEVLRGYPLTPEVKNGSIKWDNGILQDLFSKAISQFRQQKLVCFIDALDECQEDDISEMVEYIETLGQCTSEANVTLLVCLSSRHYPSLSAKDGITMILEDQEGHSIDLEQYVSHKLDPGLKTVSEIRDTLLFKAAGVFMWVVLVVNILNKEYRHGRIFAVKRRLDEIPNKLSMLFKEMLSRDNENMEEFLLSIQWILCAREPLRPEQYYYALLAGLKHGHHQLGEWDIRRVTRDNMEKYVTASSKGLAEVAKTTPRTVQFIHESVRDFIFKDGGISDIWPELQPDFQSYGHDRLKDCCYNYMVAVKSNINMQPTNSFLWVPDHNLRFRFPFANYATRHVVYHSIQAATGFTQHCFLSSFNFETWVQLRELCFDQHPLDEADLCKDLLYLLTSPDSDGCCEARTQNCSKLPPVLTQFSFQGFTPLRLAIKESCRDLLQCLLDKGADIEEKDRVGETPLFFAIKYSNQCVVADEIVQLLLDRGADIHASLYDGWTPLFWAVMRRRVAVVELLLSKGSDADKADWHGATPLHWATKHNDTVIIDKLLDQGSNIDRADRIGATPLHWAAEYDNTIIVEKLLLEGGDIDGPKNDGRTPLHLAVERDRIKTIQLLLEYGAQVNAVDKIGLTPLHIAVQKGGKASSELLLNHGAAVDAVDNYGRTPLHVAAEGAAYEGFETHNARQKANFGISNKEIVQLLLDHGAQTDTTDNDGKTPLHLAPERANEAAFELLLCQGT